MTMTNMSDIAWLSRVARELNEIEPGCWSDETNGDGSYHVLGWLNGPTTGMRISVHRASNRAGGWKLQPCAPLIESETTLNVGYVPMPAGIGFGYGRDPAAVAKRISRELLPGYRRQIAAHTEAVNAARAELGAVRRAENQIQGALDGLYRTHNGALVNRGMKPSAEFKVSSTGREVNVELRWCPVDLAVQVAELLQRYAENG